MTDDELRKLARVTPTDWEDELVALLVKVRDATRKECAREARRQGKLLCADPDSIQYRVAHEIANVIEGLS